VSSLLRHPLHPRIKRTVLSLAALTLLGTGCHSSPISNSTPSPLSTHTIDAAERKTQYLRRNCTTEDGVPGDVPGLTTVTATLIVDPAAGVDAPDFRLQVTYGFPNPNASDYWVDYDSFEGTDQSSAVDNGLLNLTASGYEWATSLAVGSPHQHVVLGHMPTWPETACDLAYWYIGHAPDGYYTPPGWSPQP
jgi:hypothetical protein